MVFDPYPWVKDRIRLLVNQVNTIKTDSLKTSPGQIWSIKKLLILDYYIGSYVKIMRKQPKFDSWCYVDTHCGTGLIDFNDPDLKDEIFPGSPIIASLRNPEFPFTEYFMSDIDNESIKTLKQRLVNLKSNVGTESYNPVVRTFEDTVTFVENKNRFGRGFLIFVDPVGFKEMNWGLMERLLRIDTADVFFTFMTYTIARHRSNVNTENTYDKSMDDFYGNSDWNKYTEGDDLLKLYVQQIRKFKKYVFKIPVFQIGERKLYDIIIATNSNGGKNVIDYGSKVMSATTTEMIRDAYKVLANKSTEITEWFPKK